MDREDLKLYAITDRSWMKEGDTLGELVEQAILGGATIVQLREKYLMGEELKALALEIQRVCKLYRVPFIVNDDVALAKEIDADGVHVGQSDMAVKEARALLGMDKIVGATAKTIEQALAAEKEGADYLGSGAVFGTTTKLDAKPMSMELLNAICEAVRIPVVAIGGIEESNIEQLKNTKIAGAAVVSGIFAKDNIRAAAECLREKLYGKKVVQCITNHVTVNEVANVILATGGSPIMAHHKLEAREVQQFSDGLLLNLGATDDYDAMEIAYKTALEENHSIVIDPVGIGGITFRREFLKKLLAFGTPSCIRGNYGEIKAIYEDTTTMRGLDCELESNADVVCALAKELSCIVVASGKTDIVSDGEHTILVESGTEMQKKVTGSGCMLSAVICTKLCNGPKPSANAVAAVCKMMGDAAESAAKSACGTMSFLQKWIDTL